jgi:PIN domain nuclease of toxin-antitoxin system
VKLLLDTHIWLWSLLDSEKLSLSVREALRVTANELWLSPISLWEVILLCERGRLDLDLPVENWIDEALRKAPMSEAPLTHRIVRQSRRVRLAHRDPADRFLIATAQALDLTLVTADERLIVYTGIRVLANR